ncbi:radical SAM protein [Candidatus Bathyarchaeota archaeon]|nr:radical SAM protein [Candidatus Bathyarchaeota archaeon]
MVLGNLVFGPVPSRRLGRSLGINNIPPKTCSYSCIYCQLGKTDNLIIERKNFYNTEDIFVQVRKKVEECNLRNEKIDYLTFVPDGEPTLDVNLGREISLLKSIGNKIAVISNASLIWREDVIKDLLDADVVSIKIDAISRDLWKKINRPHKNLNLQVILDGIKRFSRLFKGKIISETMLIKNVNYKEELINIADFLDGLDSLDRAYIAIPTRPPAEKWVKPADEETVNAAFQIFSERLGVERVEYLIGYEGNSFSFTGNIEEDLLSIMAVHPMREEAIKNLLKKANAGWQLIEDLLNDEIIMKVRYEGNTYYMRKFKR